MQNLHDPPDISYSVHQKSIWKVVHHHVRKPMQSDKNIALSKEINCVWDAWMPVFHVHVIACLKKQKQLTRSVNLQQNLDATYNNYRTFLKFQEHFIMK